MSQYILFGIVFVFSEIALAFLFQIASEYFYKKLGLDVKSIFKGIVERLFLIIALSNNHSQALTFFSAVKLATRLKHEESHGEHNRFNDYYLVGNLISVAVGIGYASLWQNRDAIMQWLRTFVGN